MVTTTRQIFISVGQRFNEILVKKLFSLSNEDYTIAEALMQMKNDPSSPRTSQRLFVYYLGLVAARYGVFFSLIYFPHIMFIYLTYVWCRYARRALKYVCPYLRIRHLGASPLKIPTLKN